MACYIFIHAKSLEWGVFYIPAHLSSEEPRFNSHVCFVATKPDNRGVEVPDILALLGNMKGICTTVPGVCERVGFWFSFILRRKKGHMLYFHSTVTNLRWFACVSESQL